MSILPGNTLSTLGSDCDNPLESLEQNLQEFIDTKDEWIKKELEHFTEKASSSLGGGSIGDILGGGIEKLEALADQYSNMDLKSLLTQTLGDMLGIPLSGGMFKDWKSTFKTLMSSLWAMHMTDNNTMWNFIDYARKSYVGKLRLAIEDANNLKSDLALVYDIYLSLSSMDVAGWKNVYKDLLTDISDDIETVSNKISMLESVLARHNILNESIQAEIEQLLTNVISNLYGSENVPKAILDLSQFKTTIVTTLREFKASMYRLESTWKNHTDMPESISKIQVRNLYGPNSLKSANMTLQSVHVEIKGSLSELDKHLPTLSASRWATKVDAVRAMVRLVRENNEPAEYTQHLSIANGLSDFLLERPITGYKQIVTDSNTIIKKINEIYTKEKIPSLDNIFSRLFSEIDDLISTMEETKTELERLLPRNLDPTTSSFLQQLNGAGFDAWFNMLASGDILGFLMATFDNASHAGQLLNKLFCLIKLGDPAGMSEELLRVYKLAKKEADSAANSALLVNFDPFEDLYKKNLSKNKDRYKKIQQQAVSAIQKFKK